MRYLKQILNRIDGGFMFKRLLTGLLLMTFLVGCGCSSKDGNQASQQNSTQNGNSQALVDEHGHIIKTTKAKDDIEVDLTTQGWQLKTINAGELGLSDRPNITQSFGGYSPDTGRMIFALWFTSEQEAKDAYSVYLNGEANIKNQDGENYQQSLVQLEGEQGIWLLRQIEKEVFGIWAPNGTSQADLISVLDSFQENAKA